MKIPFRFLCILAAIATVTSCKKDNYAAPQSILSGHLVYQGEAIPVENNQVPFQLYQYGFGKVGPVSQTFAEDGGYSAVLFDGDYKIIIPNGQGPFLWKQTAGGNPDTVNVTLKGDQTVDLEVTPYYMIRNPQIAAAGGNISASFKAEQIITDANAKSIEKVGIYINTQQFVSTTFNKAFTELAGADIADPNNISISVAIPVLVPAQNIIFARIGLKIAGVEDMIYSPLQQISF
jgi:hypothetical protein